MRPWTNRTVALGIVGLSLIFIGALVYLLRYVFFHGIIQSEFALSPNSKSYEMWKDTDSLNLHFHIYLYNWTNPEELEIPGKKPNLVQLGPYVFRERRQKVNITFHPENSTVSYLTKRTWHFDRSKSNGTLEDKVVQLNVVAVSAVRKVRYWLYFIQTTLSTVINRYSKIYVVKTVGEMLFTGYEDILITMGKEMTMEGVEVPPYDRFGWFYMRNGSSDFEGHSNIATGKDDIANIGIMKLWNHRDTVKYYKNPCNAVEGSGGEFWPPYRTKEDIRLFSADICRPLTYEYVETVKRNGIDGYRFSIGEKSLGNNTRRWYNHEQRKYFDPAKTKENENISLTDDKNKEDEFQDHRNNYLLNEGQCFCNGDCSPMGLINITACRYGAPGFISLPHFHKADPMLRDSVNGMNPNDSRHSFDIILEPITGIPLEVSARLQINILLEPSKTVSLFHNVPEIYFPMLWFEMKVAMPEYLTDDLKVLLQVPDFIGYTGMIIMAIGSLFLLIVAIIYYVKKGRESSQKKDNDQKLPTKQAETLYMDKTAAIDDNQIRIDRKLYPTIS